MLCKDFSKKNIKTECNFFGKDYFIVVNASSFSSFFINYEQIQYVIYNTNPFRCTY